jgi:hypothetical protein
VGDRVRRPRGELREGRDQAAEISTAQSRSSCHQHSISQGDQRQATVTTGHPNMQGNEHGGAARYAFQAGHAGSI